MCIFIGFNKTHRQSRLSEREGRIIETTCFHFFFGFLLNCHATQSMT